MDDLAGQVQAAAVAGLQLARGWLTSPAAWSQFALLAVAWLAAWALAARLGPPLARLLTPAETRAGLLADLRRWLAGFLPLLPPAFAYGLTAAGEAVTRQLFAAGDVAAFGKRLFLLLAAWRLARHILKDRFLQRLARLILVPVMALNAAGLLAPVAGWADATGVALGNIHFSVLTLVQGAVSGALLFWLGNWGNRQSATYIKRQEDLRPATRELALKAVEIAIFGAAFLLLMQIMGIDLTAVAVLGGALGVGVGLGLQTIAANFVSGLILLLEGQTTVGDYVELDGGEKGTIVKMTARACILETFDGRWIVVPNEHFISTRVVNYSDAGSAHRYEAAFSLSYDTDINAVPEVIASAVAALPFVLKEPEGPDCELRGFGESSVDFAVEFWVPGIDDGRNKYQSQVLFAIWNACRAQGFQMPYPHRVIEMRDARIG